MKRFLALLLALIMITCTFTSCTDSYFRFDDEIMVTRGKWLEALADSFGLTMYQQSEPYFSDINAEHPLFMYAQSAREWEVLDEDKENFYPEDVASLNFVISTAVYAVDPELNIAEGGDRFDAAMDYALQNGIAPKGVDFEADATPEQCKDILAAAQDAYLNKEITPKQEITYSDDVIDLREEEKIEVETVSEITYNDEGEVVGEGKYAVEGSKAPKVGEILILPGTKENPGGVAVKVTGVTVNADGTYEITTTQPELYEVVEEVDIAGTVAPDADEIIPVEGVTITSVTPSTGVSVEDFREAQINYLGGANGYGITQTGDKKIKGSTEDVPVDISFSVELNSKGEIKPSANFEAGMVSLEATSEDGKGLKSDVADLMKQTGVKPKKKDMSERAYKDTTQAIKDYKNGKITYYDLKKALEKEKKRKDQGEPEKIGKFEAGWKVTGTFALKDLYAEIDTKFKTAEIFGLDTGIPKSFDKFSLKLNYDVANSIKVEGNVKGELKLLSIPINFAGVGSVTIDVKMVATLNGEVEIILTVGKTDKIELKNGIPKATAVERSVSFERTFKAEVTVGPNLSITIAILGIPIIDVGATLSWLFEASAGIKYSTDFTETGKSLAIERKTVLSYGVQSYFPLFSIEIGVSKKTIANKLGLTATINLNNKENVTPKEFVKPTEYIVWSDLTTIEIGEPVTNEEGTIIDYKIIADKQIMLGVYHITLEIGEKEEIRATLPDGYKMSDIVWTSNDPSIATVSGTTITAVSKGSTNIMGKTTDGKQEVACTVTVK